MIIVFSVIVRPTHHRLTGNHTPFFGHTEEKPFALNKLVLRCHVNEFVQRTAISTAPTVIQAVSLSNENAAEPAAILTVDRWKMG